VSASGPTSSIASITIQVDNTVLQQCTNATSCTGTWQAQHTSQGTHTIRAIAVDAAGLQGSTSITIVISRGS
jgi:hypothetical protein